MSVHNANDLNVSSGANATTAPTPITGPASGFLPNQALSTFMSAFSVDI